MRSFVATAAEEQRRDGGPQTRLCAALAGCLDGDYVFESAVGERCLENLASCIAIRAGPAHDGPADTLRCRCALPGRNEVDAVDHDGALIECELGYRLAVLDVLPSSSALVGRYAEALYFVRRGSLTRRPVAA